MPTTRPAHAAHRAGLAAVAAAALTLAAPTAGLAVPAASAFSSLGSLVSAVNSANVDPGAPVTLNIHKYLGAPTGQPNDGTAQTVALPPLKGVAFDVYRVTGIDLTTDAGWALASALDTAGVSTADIQAGYVTIGGTQYNLTTVGSTTTNASGTATMSPAAGVGLYIVSENLTASGTITDGTTTYSKESITPSAPFVVTLPMTNPTEDAWLYDVHAYPKNTTDSVTKTVADQRTVTTALDANKTVNTNTTLTYTLTGSITPGRLSGSTSTLGAYVLADTVPAGASFKRVASVVVDNGSGTALATLTAGTDYDVWVDGVKNGTAVAGSLIQIAMTQTGLDALSTKRETNTKAVVVATLEVTGTLASGTITNTASIIPSNAWWQGATCDAAATYNPDSSQAGGGDTPALDNKTGGGNAVVGTSLVSNQVDSPYGSAVLTKTGADGGAVLSGAVFDLYSGVIPRNDMTNPKAADCADIASDPSAIVLTGLTTNGSGQVSLTGLQQSDYWNGTSQTTNKIVYCLVETKAPNDYNLKAQPTAFFVDQTSTPVAVSVVDEKTSLTNSLPTTGGAGAGAGLLAGLVVIGGTLTARAASSRRRKNHE